MTISCGGLLRNQPPATSKSSVSNSTHWPMKLMNNIHNSKEGIH